MARKTAAGAVSAEDFEPDAFAIRSCRKDGISHNGFRWPLDVGAIVTCPDWHPKAECGNGLHGLPEGIGDWSLIADGPDHIWLVFGYLRCEAVDLDGKIKVPRAKIAYAGTAALAMGFIRPHMVAAILRDAQGNTATGNWGHAAATGNWGHAAATGDRGHAAATGDSGHAAATGKDSVAASLGVSGTAQGAAGSWIVLAAHDSHYNLVVVKTAQIGGPENLKPDTAYRLTVAGEFVEA